MKLKNYFGPSCWAFFPLRFKPSWTWKYAPRKVALQFDKDILQNLAKNYEIVVVTGTNGKTLTTALTVGILKEVYGQVLTNPSGANMITGIATTFLTAKSSKTGKNIAVLEIDEASLSRICDYIQPSLFVITNIFRDQMDRFGEIYTTYNMILDAIRKVPTATVLLNGDSPLFYKPSFPNPIQYFGFDLEKGPAQLAHYNTEGFSVLTAKASSNMSIIPMQTWVPISVKVVDVNVLISTIV